MQVPLEIRFHNTDHSAAVERAIRDRIETLERFAGDIVSCRVTVESPHRHHHRGNLYRIAIDVRLPGREIVVSREPEADHAHEDVYIALHDAFDAVRRQIQDYVRKRRGKVKRHDDGPQGAITELHPADDYGRIGTPDGRDVYFHRNSVVNAAFDELKPGMPVRFSEEAGDRGPQATTVHVVSGLARKKA